MSDARQSPSTDAPRQRLGVNERLLVATTSRWVQLFGSLALLSLGTAAAIGTAAGELGTFVNILFGGAVVFAGAALVAALALPGAWTEDPTWWRSSPLVRVASVGAVLMLGLGIPLGATPMIVLGVVLVGVAVVVARRPRT